MPEIVKITADNDGLRLDRWFKKHYPAIPNSLLRKLLRKGAIRISGKRAKPDQKLIAGQEIKIPDIDTSTIQKPKKGTEFTREDAEKHLLENIIYKDRNIIAINKPYGLPVQDGSKVKLSIDAMLDYLKFDSDERPKLVHRIDKDTSGALLIARNSETAKELTTAFKARIIEKKYWAIVVGSPLQKSGEITLALLEKSETGRSEKTFVDEKNGRKAITFYKVVAKAGNRASLLELMPETGRKHQIRVHLAAIGCPILGDGKYGGRKAFIEGLSNKMHLHARRITFRNISIEAPLSGHFSETMDKLNFTY